MDTNTGLEISTVSRIRRMTLGMNYLTVLRFKSIVLQNSDTLNSTHKYNVFISRYISFSGNSIGQSQLSSLFRIIQFRLVLDTTRV